MVELLRQFFNIPTSRRSRILSRRILCYRSYSFECLKKKWCTTSKVFLSITLPRALDSKTVRFYQKRDAGNLRSSFVAAIHSFTEYHALSREDTVVHDDDSHRTSSLTQISLSLPRDCICRTRGRISREVVEIVELRNLHLALRASIGKSLPRIRRYARSSSRTRYARGESRRRGATTDPPWYGEPDAPRSRQPLTSASRPTVAPGGPGLLSSAGRGGRHARRVVGYVRSGSTRLVLSQRPIRGTWTRRLRSAPRLVPIRSRGRRLSVRCHPTLRLLERTL